MTDREARWIVELEPGWWLYSIQPRGVYATDDVDSALRKPSERAGQRALQCARKRARLSYPTAKIVEVSP